MNVDDIKCSIFLNGAPHPVRAGAPLPELLAALGLGAGTVLVEHNGRALFPKEWPAIQLRDGDRLEIIRVVAGG